MLPPSLGMRLNLDHHNQRTDDPLQHPLSKCLKYIWIENINQFNLNDLCFSSWVMSWSWCSHAPNLALLWINNLPVMPTPQCSTPNNLPWYPAPGTLPLKPCPLMFSTWMTLELCIWYLVPNGLPLKPCPAPDTLPLISYPSCPVPDTLSLISCPWCPIPDTLPLMSCPWHPAPDVLSLIPCPDVLLLIPCLMFLQWFLFNKKKTINTLRTSKFRDKT